uniref:uncharacterized protein LOC122587952 n=1 Tax=Erigeron canadensis TaxID=72917 RepID=UPI001CB9A695|nr:uncharacterized protein LOC122587952 [Erigeron canadensis]
MYNTNVGIFASPEQHSLFPMTIPCPNISSEDYRVFYRHERRLLTLLLVSLHREVAQSILILGFLLWVEREGYTSKNLVQTILRSLSLDVVNLVIDEVVICLKCIEKKENKAELDQSNITHNIELLQNFLDRKKICLKELHKNCIRILDEVSCIAKDVCHKALDDIMHQFIKRDTPLPTIASSMADIITTTCTTRGSISRYLSIGPSVPFPSSSNSLALYTDSTIVALQNRPIFANGSSLNRMLDLGKSSKNIFFPSLIKDDQEHEVVSPDDRTIFLTFSKGYPISESEVRDYFTSYFGDFIEEIYMHDVGPDEQSLYARIVAFSACMVKVIVERDGPHGKSKYNINGKHVWARKYVKKKPSRMSPN